MANKTVKIGFIGCGGIAEYHFSHFENDQIPEAQITAVCDLSLERAQVAAQRFSARAYDNYGEMLEKEKLDAIYVCVIPCAHDGMELQAIQKGCHLFVEKPVSLDLNYAKQVENALQAKNLIHASGFQDRYLDFVPLMKSWLANQKIGFFDAWWVDDIPKVWWWRKRETSGGQAVEQSVHIFDMCRHLFGEIVEVQAFARRGLNTDIEGCNIEDASIANLKFENGIIGSVHSGCFMRGAGKKSGIEVFTQKGLLSYQERESVTITEPHRHITATTGNDYGLEEDLAFIDAILEKDQSLILSSYTEAVKNLQVTLAVNESIDNGGALIRLK